MLAARGISSPPDVDAFLHPDIRRDWSDPAAIPGMTAVVDALEEAVRARRRIRVFGDFDVDGISATACMLRGLAALGAQADYLIPNRADEGYGLTSAALKRVYERDPEVLITVDCGISAGNEAVELLERGIQVLITDHHEPSDLVPAGIPVADPKLDEDSPQAILAGVGVALKLIAALGERFGQPHLWRDLVDLATLGTLADVMPLIGENRSLVAEGLGILHRSPRPGVAALLALAQRGGNGATGANGADGRSKGPSAIDLSYSLIPRLNAAGRMGDSTLALELLMNDDPPRSFEIANALDAANSERRAVEGALLKETLAQAKVVHHGQKILIVAGEDWHEGIRGIVAARLTSRFGVPAIVFSLMGDEARGSGRSIGAVNLFAAVERCADLTLRFGGHEAAVGVTVARDMLDAFKERMEAIMEQEPPEAFHPPLLVDAQLTLGELDVEAVEELGLLEPHGHANREPLFVSCDLSLRNARAVGANKNHLSFTATDGQASVQGIWFQCPNIETFIACTEPVDIIYRLQVDEWNGLRRVKLMVNQIVLHDESGDGADEREEAAAAVDEREVGERSEDEGAASAPAPASAATPVERALGAEPAMEAPASAASAATPRASWEHKARANSPSFIHELAAAIVGKPVKLHAAQAETLAALAAGQSVLAIMATGRGKSLIFQAHAARLALATGKASVFIYPLRALIADQAVHLAESFARLGLVACALTGENSPAEKDAIFQRFYEQKLDVILTTPEFFGIHAWRFAEAARVGFIVFDEAHHIKTEGFSGREGYSGVARLRAGFPSIQCLAVTATSDDRITSGIRLALGIERVIIDDTRRENLTLADARSLRDRDAALLKIVAHGDKTVIYTNSRNQALLLARLLRKQGGPPADRTPATEGSRSPATTSALTSQPPADRIAFYHAGLTRPQRRAIEAGLRSGRLTVVISTSAFGEGIDIPDLARVVLYHLPLNAVAFNQMSGRAGRNGRAAVIHLLYSSEDVDTNRRLLASSAPSREQLVILYRVLRDEGGTQHESVPSLSPFLCLSAAELLEACRAQSSACVLDERGVLNGLAIFEELGLLVRDESYSPPRITLISRQRVELSSSSIYLEGEEERALFERFVQWALTAPVEELREQIIGPLVPSDSGYASGNRHASANRRASGSGHANNSGYANDSGCVSNA
jgi:single-stranded-DNA-specific exonuclease